MIFEMLARWLKKEWGCFIGSACSVSTDRLMVIELPQMLAQKSFLTIMPLLIASFSRSVEQVAWKGGSNFLFLAKKPSIEQVSINLQIWKRPWLLSIRTDLPFTKVLGGALLLEEDIPSCEEDWKLKIFLGCFRLFDSLALEKDVLALV